MLKKLWNDRGSIEIGGVVTALVIAFLAIVVYKVLFHG